MKTGGSYRARRPAAVPTAEATSSPTASRGYGADSTRAVTFQPGWLLALALLNLAVTLVAPQLGTVLGSILTFGIVWLARPEFLPALIVSQVGWGDIDFSRVGSTAPGVEEIGTVTLAGFPFSLKNLLALGVVARVTWELCNEPRTFRDCRWLLVMWSLTFIPACIMAFTGKAEGNLAWLLPIRTVCMFGGYFYGYILGRHWRSDNRVVADGLLPVVAGILFMVALGVFTHKFRFLLAPAAVPIAWHAWQIGGRFRRLLAVAVLGLAVMQGFGIHIPWRDLVGQEVVEDRGGAHTSFGVGRTTLTSNLLFLGSVLLTIAINLRWRTIREILPRMLGAPAFVFILAFSLGIAIIGPWFWTEVREAKVARKELTVPEKLRAKLFDDRSLIWNATLAEALKPPYLLKPAGRSVWINHPSEGLIEWKAGAHNAVINTLQRQCWFNGPILFLFMLMAMMRNAATFARSIPGGLDALAVCVTLTAIVGGVVNDYPLDIDGSFWFLSLAGLVALASATAAEPENVLAGLAHRRKPRPDGYR